MWSIGGKQLQVRGLRFPKRNQLHPVWFLDYHSLHIQHHHISGGKLIVMGFQLGQELVEKNNFQWPRFLAILFNTDWRTSMEISNKQKWKWIDAGFKSPSELHIKLGPPHAAPSSWWRVSTTTLTRSGLRQSAISVLPYLLFSMLEADHSIISMLFIIECHFLLC